MSQHLIRGHRAIGVLFLIFVSISFAFSQESSVAFFEPGRNGLRDASSPRTLSDPATVVANFIAAERKVREALNQHTFKRDVVLQTIGPNGEVTGEYIRNSQFVFDDRGRRIERVLFHPGSTIREMRITKEDIQDLAGSQLLGIDITETGKYVLTFTGIETIDSRQLFAIDVRPLTQPDPHRMKDRYFVGRVWVDPANFQIIKIKGIVEPQGKQRFPRFETWREPVLGAFAFPTRTEADDVLHFLARDVHYRIKVRYFDYKLFGSKVSITEIDEPLPPDEAPTEKLPSSTKPRGTPPDSNDVSSKTKPPVAPGKNEICTANRNAPPVGAYHWPADTEVKVYFVRSMFTSEQRSALLEAMRTWSAASEEIGSGVRFVDAGETATRQSCRSCLTIGRKDVYKQDKHHYAFFHPMNRDADRLVSAWIDLDFGITNIKALKGFMVHELGHGLGLWDCTKCKKNHTIMNGFPGINKDNGLIIPSRCDLATVKEVYRQERQVALASSDAKSFGSPTTVANLAPPSPKMQNPGLLGRNLQPSPGGAIAQVSGNKPAPMLQRYSPSMLLLLDLDNPSSSLQNFRRSKAGRSTAPWGAIF
jgi:hypothetical protein